MEAGGMIIFSSLNQSFDTTIIGGGAAGLMCAAVAGAQGRSVLVIEHRETVGKKIRISGGGRCNFTNVNTTPQNFISRNPHFCKSALARYTPFDFIRLVEKHGIAYHEKKLGQLFCDGSAQEIIDMLCDEAGAVGAELMTNCRVRSVTKEARFVLETNQGIVESDRLVIATGGRSIPTLGASDFAYRIAEQFGVPVIPTAPALVPLTLPDDTYADLSGVSVDVIVRCNGVSFRENMLFTHRGLSGPAILQISSYWNDGDAISVDLFPGDNGLDVLQKHRSEKAQLRTFLSHRLPSRLAQKLCDTRFESKPMYQYTPKELQAIAEGLQNWEIYPNGTEGYHKAEVTRGGIDTDYLSSKTMEVKHVPGLYFIGESVDVTGWLGGYNFQWAWASAVAAAF